MIRKVAVAESRFWTERMIHQSEQSHDRFSWGRIRTSSRGAVCGAGVKRFRDLWFVELVSRGFVIFPLVPLHLTVWPYYDFTAVHCTAQHSNVHKCTVLYSTALPFTALYYFSQHHTLLHWTEPLIIYFCKIFVPTLSVKCITVFAKVYSCDRR